MMNKEKARANFLEALGIEVILKALYLYCNGGNCNGCQYINRDGTCNALEKTLQEEDFVNPDDIPFGDDIRDDEDGIRE